jgi:DNA-3-methyladenine glycosylase
MPAPERLPPSFYARETLTVARELLGMYVVHRDATHLRAGRIVETEAYKGPHDLAAHSAKGRTPRTEVMFGPPGHAYVYLIYGMWNCLNVVTASSGVPHAVLIRALEPIAHVELPTHGPGLLCRAMKIDRGLNGADLQGPQLWIERPAKFVAPKVARATRIGVDYAGSWAQKRWRFYDAKSAYVSTVSPAARKRALGEAKQPTQFRKKLKPRGL